MPVIRQQTQFVNQPIGVSSFDTGAQQVSRAVSEFANNIGQMAYNIGAQEAEKRGTEQAQAIDVEKIRTFDPETGKPQALTSTRGMGNIARQAFERVVDRRFAETITQDIRLKSREIASQYENPNQYDQMFSGYLGKLTEGADDRFRNMVMEVGGYELANTKITLADRARARARAAMADGIVSANNAANEEVFDLAMNGDIEATLATINARASATSDGEQAELVRGGSASRVQDGLVVTAYSAILQNIHQTATPLQSTNLDRYVASQGKYGGEALSQEQKAQVDALLPYVNVNNANDILRASAGIQGDVNRVRAIEADIAQRQAEYDMRLSIIQYGDMNDTAVSTLAQGMAPAFESANLPQIGGYISSAQATYNSFEQEVQGQFLRGSITENNMSSILSDRKDAYIETILTQAAITGTQEQIGSMAAALASGDPRVIATLTPQQQQTIVSLRATNLLDGREDFANSLLSRSKDSFLAKRENEIATANLLAQHENMLGMVEAGVAEAPDIEAHMQSLSDGVGPLITGETYNSMATGLQTAQGKGLANAASQYASSADMIALSNYVKSNGSEAAGITPYYKSIGDAILQSSGPNDAVVGHINALQTRIGQKEAERKTLLEAQQRFVDIQSGRADGTDPKVREAVDTLLERNGIDLSDPASFTPEIQSVLRIAPSQKLVDDLSSIADGRSVSGSSVMLQHYVALANDPAGNVFVNRFAGILSDERIAQLNDIAAINKDTGRPVDEIALMLSERRNDPVSREIRSETLGGNSPSQWLMKTLEVPASIATELAPVVDYYALTGKTSDEIKLLAQQIYDGKYVETSTVVDPRYPISDKNRSRYALEVTIPEEGARDEFLRIISNDLPSGYYLNTENKWWMLGGLIGGPSKEERPVFLIPDTSSNGLRYYTATLDDSGSLQMLIYEKDGEMVWPMYDRSELDAYYADKAIADQRALEEAQARELGRQAITWEGYARLQQDLANRGQAAYDDYQALVFGRGQ